MFKQTEKPHANLLDEYSDFMITEILLAMIIYVLFNFAFTYPWNIMMFKDTYDDLSGEIPRDEPIIPLGVSAMVLEALAMALIFDTYLASNVGLLEALKVAYLVGLFSTLYGALVVPAKFKIAPISKYVYLELAHGFLQFTGIGIIFSLIF